MKLLFSLLVSSDFYSTSEFMNKKKIEDIGILNNVDDFISSFKNLKFIMEFININSLKIINTKSI